MAAVTIALGVAIMIFGDTKWKWLICCALLAIGAFQLFEGWKGWCALRAMGIKTKI
jgi:hypothetical protein